MKHYTYQFAFSHVPPVMKRGEHVLIVIKIANRYVLGGKDIYPPDIYRLVGGGMDQDEPLTAAAREVEEELGVSLKPSQLEPLAVIDASITETTTNRQYLFSTHLFFTTLASPKINPADDLDRIVLLSPEEMSDLIDRYQNLPDALVDIGGNKQGLFRWSDYGQFYAKIHQLALDLTQEK